MEDADCIPTFHCSIIPTDICIYNRASVQERELPELMPVKSPIVEEPCAGNPLLPLTGQDGS
jgi:hypothetical protein